MQPTLPATQKQEILFKAPAVVVKYAGPEKVMGKSGVVRVIYTVKLKRGAVVLLTIYSKNVQDTISANILRKIAEELDYD